MNSLTYPIPKHIFTQQVTMGRSNFTGKTINHNRKSFFDIFIKKVKKNPFITVLSGPVE